MRFDLTTLNLVLAIAQTRSITRGAEREHLALAAASKRLSDLETRLGVALFERRARGVEPTEAGRALVRHVRALHAGLHALESEVMEFAHGIKGHLRIAANASAIAECLPADLADFSRAHQGIRISLEDLTSAEVQAAVADGRADVGVFVPPLHDSRLHGLPYRQGELAVLVPLGHALARPAAGPAVGDAAPDAPDAPDADTDTHIDTDGSATSPRPSGVRFDALLDYDIVGLHLGAAVHEQMRERAQASGRTLNVRVQVRGFDAIAQLVEAGLGVAVLPKVVAQRFARVFAVQPLALDEPWARRDYLLAVRAQDVQPAVVQRFLDALCPGHGASATSPAATAARPSRPRRKASP
ncbi:MAG: hypothetical protein RIQ53_2341 [Pseudomonadota bacterium]